MFDIGDEVKLKDGTTWIIVDANNDSTGEWYVVEHENENVIKEISIDDIL